MLPRLMNNYTLGNCIAQDLTNDTGLVGTSTGSDAGATAGTTMPNNAALVISWHIGRHYRGGHPRMYFGGLNAGDISNGNRISGSAMTSWNTSVQAFFTALKSISNPLGGQFVPVALHRQKVIPNPSPPPDKEVLILNPVLKDQINSVSLDNRIDSQRRRLGKP
jgi:hypothetical protein